MKTLVPAALVAAVSWSLVGGTGAAAGGTLGLLPDTDPDRQARLVAAIEEVVPEGIRLVVGTGGGHWSGTTETLRRLLDEEAVDALLVPPDRSVAHLAAQLASRRHVPAFEIALRGSRGATSARTAGTFWLVTCRAPEDRGIDDDDELELAAHMAVAAASSVLAGGYRAGQAARDWRGSLPPACRDEGDAVAPDSLAPAVIGPPSVADPRGSAP